MVRCGKPVSCNAIIKIEGIMIVVVQVQCSVSDHEKNTKKFDTHSLIFSVLTLYNMLRSIK